MIRPLPTCRQRVLTFYAKGLENANMTKTRISGAEGGDVDLLAGQEKMFWKLTFPHMGFII